MGARGTELAQSSCTWVRQQDGDRVFDGIEQTLGGGRRIVANVQIGVSEVFLGEAVPDGLSGH